MSMVEKSDDLMDCKFAIKPNKNNNPPTNYNKNYQVHNKAIKV